MWYFYNLSLLQINEMKNFTEDFEKVMLNLFDEIDDIFKDNLENFEDESANESIYDCIKNFQTEYLKLEKKKKRKIRKIFFNNYEVKRILNKEIKAYSYEELKRQCGEDICNAEKKLSKFMYDKLKDRVSFKNKYITPLEYYKKLKVENITKSMCPFCGQANLETGELGTREPYDHYIPRSKYPFISLHYYNLVPMCHKCNSTYKGGENVLNYSKIFDPFKNENSENELLIKKITILTPITSAKNKNIILRIINKEEYREEITSWDKIFKIKSRSKETLNELYEEVIEELLAELREIVDDNDGIQTETEIDEKLKKKIKGKMKHKHNYRYLSNNIFYKSLYKYYFENDNDRKLLLKSL